MNKLENVVDYHTKKKKKKKRNTVFLSILFMLYKVILD